MKRRFSRRSQNSYELLEARKLLAADVAGDNGVLPDVETEPTALMVVEARHGGEQISQSEDVVIAWNNLFNDLLVLDTTNQNPGYASRAMAMLNLAIYDAVNIAGGSSSDTFYDYDVPETSRTRISVNITASQAAYTVLSDLYSDHQATIDAFHDSLINNERNRGSMDASIDLGTEIGNTIIDARANDGSSDVIKYDYDASVGSFQADPLNPDVPVWGPGWGDVETFSISAATDFSPPTTPELSSEQYALSYNEVKELGSVDSTARTDDQTEAGIFWAYDREGLGTPISLFSDTLESIAIQQGNTLTENAALFAQASVAMADAAIVAWETKFSENFWRPVTAIHQGDLDENPLTEADLEWTALGAPDGGNDIIGFTPQFPTYISGHATFGGALFGAIREFYGTDDIAFDLTSKELEILIANPELEAAYGLDLDDATRSFDSLSQAMAENGRSRVYLGIHFDFDDLVGQEVGQAVASAVASSFSVPDDGDNHQDRPHPDRPRPTDRPKNIGRSPQNRPTQSLAGESSHERRPSTINSMSTRNAVRFPTSLFDEFGQDQAEKKRIAERTTDDAIAFAGRSFGSLNTSNPFDAATRSTHATPIPAQSPVAQPLASQSSAAPTHPNVERMNKFHDLDDEQDLTLSQTDEAFERLGNTEIAEPLSLPIMPQPASRLSRR